MSVGLVGVYVLGLDRRRRAPDAAWYFGAVRLAKPESWWARRFDDDAKGERAAAELPRRRRQALVAIIAALVVTVAAWGC